MADSNLVPVIDRLVEVLPGAAGIPFSWSYDGQEHGGEADYGYVGQRVQGPVVPAAMAGGARFTRQEDLQVSLAIETFRKGEKTARAAVVAAMEYGRLVQEYLAGNWTLGGDINGLLRVSIADMDLNSGIEDGNAFATLTYTLQLSSHVR